jgi:hypothetical protein
MNIEDIVRLYLVDHGFDGLFNTDGECACLLGDLFPCSGDTCNILTCEAGYKRDATGEEKEELGWDWCVCAKKEDQP